MTNHEVRMTNQIRMTNDERVRRHSDLLRHCFVILVSTFGLFAPVTITLIDRSQIVLNPCIHVQVSCP